MCIASNNQYSCSLKKILPSGYYNVMFCQEAEDLVWRWSHSTHSMILRRIIAVSESCCCIIFSIQRMVSRKPLLTKLSRLNFEIVFWSGHRFEKRAPKIEILTSFGHINIGSAQVSISSKFLSFGVLFQHYKT